MAIRGREKEGLRRIGWSASRRGPLCDIPTPLGDNQYAIRDGQEDEEGGGDDDCRPRNWIGKVGLERNAVVVGRWDRRLDRERHGGRELFVGARRLVWTTGCESSQAAIATEHSRTRSESRTLRTAGLFICRNSGGKWRRRGTCG